MVKQALRLNPSLAHDELIEMRGVLWNGAVHEQRMAAVEVLVARPDLVTSSDMSWIEGLLREAKTWALVDDLARKVVASLAVHDACVLDTLDRWVVDRDFWIRRAAVLALSQLPGQGRGLDRFLRYATSYSVKPSSSSAKRSVGWRVRSVAAIQAKCRSGCVAILSE